MLADQIVGIQPMTGNAGQVFVMKNRWYTKRFELMDTKNLKSHYGLITNVTLSEFAEISQYCIDTFGDDFTIEDNKFWFKSEADRTLFLLRWEE